MILLATAAFAAPDRLASTITVGTEVRDIVATSDGAYVGWTDSGSNEFTVLDTASWASTAISLCTSGIRGAAVVENESGGHTFFSGCEDGTVASVTVDEDGAVAKGTVTATVGDGPVYGVETDGETIFAVVESEGDLVVAAFTAADGSETTLTGYPTSIGSGEVEDTVVVGDYLVITDGTDDVAKVALSSGTAVTSQGTLGSRTYTDAWPYATASVAYLADTGGGVAKYGTGTNDFTASLTAIADTITALAIDPDEGFMLLGAGNDTLLYGFSGGPSSEEDTITGAANIDEFALTEGYAFGATSDGYVHILTDRPWVGVQEVSPTSATDGDTITYTFTSDTAGTYKILVGGTAAGDGDEVADGSVDAGETVTVDFEVDDTFAEGANRVWVFVDDGATVGHAAGLVTVDNPPDAVHLGAGVGFGNASISVQFDGIEDEDLAGYVIYVDVEPFTADEFPIGGPGFSGTDDVTLPVIVTAEPKASVSRTIYPVTNGTTYYVAVRAYDDGGLEGPMSDVQSVIPQPTYSASQLAGDEGWGCGLGLGAGFPAVLLGALAVARRRVAPVLGAAAVVGALGVPTAHAKDTETPRSMNVQVRYGPITIKDEYVDQVFGTKANEMLWFEYGFASQYVDANLGLGFYQEMGWLQTADGGISDEHDMFTMFPVTLTLTGRLDIFKEQPIVPFGRIGADYWMWRENWYVPDPDSMDFATTGGKPGWHFGGGLMLLLDPLDRAAASKLESTAGIDDTYLVAEYRKTLLMHGDQQLNLSSDELSFGLKFDF